MALLNFRRCRDACCSEPQVPTAELVRTELFPKMTGKDMLILSYTRCEMMLVVGTDEPALLLTGHADSGERQYTYLVENVLFYLHVNSLCKAAFSPVLNSTIHSHGSV